MGYTDTGIHWAKSWIDRVARKRKMTGDANGTTFRPEAYVKRGEMAVMMDRTVMAWGEVYAYALPSVVWIGRGAHGTGFVFTESGYIVTAKHVIGDGKDFNDLSDWQNVRFQNGTYSVADVVKGHPFADLAILKLRNKGNYPALTIDDETVVRMCDEAMVIGHPGNEEWIAQRSYIEKVTVANRKYEFDLNGGFSGGMSGGPVLNQCGEVLGIIIRSSGDCTSLVELKKWVEDNTK